MSLRDAPIWITLAVAAFVPSTAMPWLTVVTIPVSLKDVWIAVVGISYVCLYGFRFRFVIRRRPWDLHLSWVLMLLVVYSSVSVSWSGAAPRDVAASLWTLTVTGSILMIAYAAIEGKSTRAANVFLWKLTLFLAVVAAIYFAESFVGLGLRSDAGRSIGVREFGVQRVRGPLWTSTTIQFALVPILGVVFGLLLEKRAKAVTVLFVLVAALAAILGSGSRSAVLSLLLFVVLAIALVNTMKARLTIILVTVTVALIAAAIVFHQAQSDRLVSLEDSYRTITHETTFEILKQRSIAELVVGSGYGSLWPWYLRDIDDTESRPVVGMDSTPWGRLLYHPHSLFLMLVAEIGMIGLLLGACLIRPAVDVLVRYRSVPGIRLLACAVIATFPALFVNLMIFKNWGVSLVWIIFYFGLLRKR